LNTGRTGDDARAVLIVDDEPGFSSALGKRLRMRGFECVLAPDGETALEIIGSRVFLAVLLDLRLPGLQGAEVLQRLREIDRRLPVIVVTAHGTEDDRDECLGHGAREFLTKPVDVNEIAGHLARYRKEAE
jgi:DNA-binding response OmpR family regulator